MAEPGISGGGMARDGARVVGCRDLGRGPRTSPPRRPAREAGPPGRPVGP